MVPIFEKEDDKSRTENKDLLNKQEALCVEQMSLLFDFFVYPF